MSTRTVRALLALTVLVGAAGVVVANRTGPEQVVSTPTIGSASDLAIETESAPAVTATGWLNTEALNASDLEGKVVLYDFWTFGCVNCRRTLPHVKAWHERYAKDGLVVLSIHTPEFDYEADPAAVRKFVTDNAIRYPVALDPDMTTWRAFSNRAWPAFYLHDDEGRRRLTRIGEHRYDETEDAIRVLLEVDPDSPRATVVST